MDTTRIAFVAAPTEEAQSALAALKSRYGDVAIEDAAVVVALGGDGFMLQTLHTTMNSGKMVYGMNRGSIGFLMNRFSLADLPARIERAVANICRPLEMRTVDADGQVSEALAINEVYLFRQSYQAAKLRVDIDGRTRLHASPQKPAPVANVGDSGVIRVQVGGHPAPREFTAAARIGRDPACALQVDDDGVSRAHAEIFPLGGQWWVRDLGSSNRTYLDGQRIK